MKSHDVRMLRKPERRLLLEDVFAVPVHHAGAKDMFATTGGDQRPQLLLSLLLGQPVQIEKQLRRIIAAAQFFQFKMAHVRTDIFDRPFGIQQRLKFIGKIVAVIGLLLK